jgi:hypothetical protein
VPALPRPPSSLCRPKRPAPIPYGRFPKQEAGRKATREGRREKERRLLDVWY